jgi:sulfate permease, SulP family
LSVVREKDEIIPVSMSTTKFSKNVSEVFQSTDWLPNIFSGLISGLVALTYSLSLAALVFSGSLASYLPQGVNVVLISATVIGVGVALGSSLPFAIAGPDPNSTAILALIAAAIATQLESQNQPDAIFPTVLMAIAISAVLASFFLFVLGRLHLGHFVRFVPYPVIGGFLAGTGWLIMRGSFTVMVGTPLSIQNLPTLLHQDAVVYWVPGLCLAVLLLIITSRYKHFLVVPSMLVGAIALAHILLALSGVSLDQARDQGWLLSAVSTSQPSQILNSALFSQVQWSVLGGQVGNVMAMMAVIAIAILLNATGLEVSTATEANLNRELQASGLANLVAGLCGGMVGYLSFNRSLLNYKAGANGPLAGVVAGLFCGGVLLFGTSVLSYIPRSVLGGLLLFIGLSSLTEWLYKAKNRLPLLDYGLVVIIVLVIAASGFLEGVSAGLVIACLLFAFNYSRTQVIRSALAGSIRPSNFERSLQQQRSLQQRSDQLYILRLQGYIFFGTADTLLNHIRQRLFDDDQPAIQFLVLDFRLVSGLDSSAIFSFVKLRQLALKFGLSIVFTHLDPDMEQQLLRNGGIQPNDDLCHVFSDLDHGIQWCEDQILETVPLKRRRFIPLSMQLPELLPLNNTTQQFMSYLEKLVVPAGHVIFQRGEDSNGLYWIESGQISILWEQENGIAKRLRTLSTGNIFGEMAFYRNSQRSASAIADKPSNLYRLSKESLEKMEVCDPQLANVLHQYVIRLLAERLTQTTKELETYD